jgi:hypothetical protein
MTVGSSATLRFAAHYVARGWRIFPVRHDKRPLTGHGHLDASLDMAQIGEWWKRWPDALIAIATGEPSGVVALDVDIRPGVHGPDSLEALGVTFHPATPTAHTPSGGYHCLFQWPGHDVKTIAGKLGAGLDVRGDGGSLILPPGPGRFWDPHLAYDGVPLAEMPSWMKLAEPEPRPPPSGRPVGTLDRYNEVALDHAIRAILEAPAGQQRHTLNREAFSIATLVEGAGMPPSLALQALHWAASQVTSHNRHRPWRPRELEKKVDDAFRDGLRHPRERRHG